MQAAQRNGHAANAPGGQISRIVEVADGFRAQQQPVNQHIVAIEIERLAVRIRRRQFGIQQQPPARNYRRRSGPARIARPGIGNDVDAPAARINAAAVLAPWRLCINPAPGAVGMHHHRHRGLPDWA